MKTTTEEDTERLIRVRATRREKQVELRIHYQRTSDNGCDTYEIFSVEEMYLGTGPIDSFLY